MGQADIIRMEDKICVAMLCNAAYYGKMLGTLSMLLATGYEGDICLVVGDDLAGSTMLGHPMIQGRVEVKHFPDVKFSAEFDRVFYSMDRYSHWMTSRFQYHKLHLFDAFFKRWDYVFYIDCGVKVYSPILPMLEARRPGKLLAHSDAYPVYEWRLRNQFDQASEGFAEVESRYDLDVDYPQTTIMLYDTTIISEGTYDSLVSLAEEVKCSRTNDQGVIALYFTNVDRRWEQIPLGDDELWFYDYFVRDDKRDKPHIMVKG